jgi:hypothetical protein
MTRPIDLAILIAAIFIAAGVFVLLWRNYGGGGGQDPFVVPSSPLTGGGWRPGFVSTQVSNGGTGGSSPRVQFN